MLLNWAEIAMQSEFEFSRALGGKITYFDNFVHIHNTSIPWGGDFNCTLGVKVCNTDDFDFIENIVKSIHEKYKLFPPDRFDIYPPVLSGELWREYLKNKGYYLSEVIFFQARTLDYRLSNKFYLYVPSENEYIDWFYKEEGAKDYYNDVWFEQIKPLKKKFISRFKPYWFFEDNVFKGWLYGANLGQVFRLFEVEIMKEYRGQGLGRKLLEAIRHEAGKNGAEYVLLQSNDRLRAFYEKADFEECSRNSVIRLRYG